MYQDISGVQPVSVVRKSRSGETLVAKMSDDSYRTFSTTLKKFVGDAYESLSDIQNIGGFLRVSDENSAALVASLAPEEPEDVKVFDSGKRYRVPQSIAKDIALNLFALKPELTSEEYQKASALASGEPVGLDEIMFINNHFLGNDPGDLVRGGFKGRKWAERILAGEGLEDEVGYDPYAKYKFEDDPDFDYMALGPDRDSVLVDRLVRLDWASDAVYMWTSTGFVPMTETDIEGFDYPYVCPIDLETAQILAKWLDENPYDLYDVRDADPEARNLFDTAYDEIDFEEVDRYAVVVADASGYTPAERSLNARRQVRGFHGRFGGRQVKQTTKLKAYKKGHLSDKPVIDPAPGKTIKSWLAEHDTVTAAAAPKQGRSQSIAQPDANPVGHSQVHHDKSADWTGQSAADEKAEEKETGLKDAIYFAVVDADDATAVLDVVAITRNEDGQPEAWRRVAGSWKGDPDTLAKLMGSTPPPVVNLGSPELVKAVLAQVDNHDAHPGDLPTDAVTDSEPPAINAGGFQEQQSLVIEDVEALKSFVSVLEDEPDVETKIYLRRRATAFNRLDIIPEAWRVASTAEQGMELASESPLFGEYGEVLVAAGHPFQGAKGAERLKEYWTTGAGAAKIRWGTRGDLTRAHRHLAKFVGPDRAWGLAQNYHERLFGMSNTKHDKLTGQYVSHHGGKH